MEICEVLDFGGRCWSPGFGDEHPLLQPELCAWEKPRTECSLAQRALSSQTSAKEISRHCQMQALNLEAVYWLSCSASLGWVGVMVNGASWL